MAWILRMQGQAPLARTPPACCLCSHTSSASSASLTFPPGSPLGSCWLQWQSDAGPWSLWTSVNDACSREQPEQRSGYCPPAQDVCHSVWEINDHTNQTLCSFPQGKHGGTLMDGWCSSISVPPRYPCGNELWAHNCLGLDWVKSLEWQQESWRKDLGTAEEVLPLVPLHPLCFPLSLHCPPTFFIFPRETRSP